jgi:hypothetical protein
MFYIGSQKTRSMAWIGSIPEGGSDCDMTGYLRRASFTGLPANALRRCAASG